MEVAYFRLNLSAISRPVVPSLATRISGVVVYESYRFVFIMESRRVLCEACTGTLYRKKIVHLSLQMFNHIYTKQFQISDIQRRVHNSQLLPLVNYSVKIILVTKTLGCL